VTTVGQVAAMTENALVTLLGPALGRQLHALAHNRDPRRVRRGRRRRSIGAQSAFRPSSLVLGAIDPTLIGVVERVARRMRRAGRVGRTVILRLRFGDFSRATRSRTLPRATAQTATLLEAARGLLVAAMPTIERRGLTLLGVSVTNLEDGSARQLALPAELRASLALDAAVDEVRERYGVSALTRAVLLGRGEGFSVPRLPD
jgi:DNA polymerase-4